MKGTQMSGVSWLWTLGRRNSRGHPRAWLLLDFAVRFPLRRPALLQEKAACAASAQAALGGTLTQWVVHSSAVHLCV